MIQLLLLGLSIHANLSCIGVQPLLPQPVRQEQISLRSCRFPDYPTELLCGAYPVYENRGARSGRTILLNLIVVPSSAAEPTPDPVFFLSGGPGQGAARIARAFEDPLMRELRRDRDLVFVDQRGTGDSNRLSCTITTDRTQLLDSFQEIFQAEMIRRCRQALDKNAELNFYTTPIAMDDLEEVRQALGYDKINLYGVSYGSLAALEYLRRYSHHVRSAVLAGVATPAAKLPLQFAKGAERAMDKLIEDCANEESCRSSFPRLRDDFVAALNQFATGPVRFDLKHPMNKTVQSITLTRGVFADQLRLMLYDNSSSRMIPLLIHRAALGDWFTFGQVIAASTLLAPYSLALGTYLTITCSESVPYIAAAELKQETSDTFLGGYRTRRHQLACNEWPRGQIPTDYFTPVASDVPVLMLSGELDPSTPVEFGKAAARHLPNSRQIVLRNTPHSYTSRCARTITVEFIAKGRADDLDTSCAARLRRPRFVPELPARNDP
jgi:pimeloyl-ACP methyl ester carboxylesterase